MKLTKTGTVAIAATIAAGLGIAYVSSNEEQPSPDTHEAEPLLLRPTAENIAAIKTLFEKNRAELIATTPIELAAKKAASPDGEGRIVVKGDTIEIFEKPLVAITGRFDIDRNAEGAAERIISEKPEVFSLTGDAFETAVYNVLTDGLNTWYVPSVIVYQTDDPIATYNVDSDRVCQPLAEVWNDAKNNIDCFPAETLSADTQLAADIAAIKRHLAGPALMPR